MAHPVFGKEYGRVKDPRGEGVIDFVIRILSPRKSLRAKEAVEARDRISKGLKKEGYSLGDIALILNCSRSMAEKYTKR